MDPSPFFEYPTRDRSVTRNEAVFWADRSRHDWTRLLAHTETYRFRAGELVLRQGDPQRALYVVAFGRFESVLPGTARAMQLRRVPLEAGYVFGEQSFLDGQPAPVDVRAVTDAEAVRLSFDAFEIFAAREPDLARALLLDLGRIVSERLRQAAVTEA